ncbi:hypothetical protein BsWGS_18603 [Bradybaena similaris]
MANQPSISTGPSNVNAVLKPEESVTILFHGRIPALHVTTKAPASFTCEEVEVMCLNHIQNFVCAKVTKDETHGANKYLPAFGLLALPEEKIWLPLNYVFKKNTADNRKYRFRVRFRPPSDKFSDGNVMCEYLFLQTLDDFLKGSLGKSTKLCTKTAFCLLTIALMFPKTFPQNSMQTVNETFKSRRFYFWNFTKHFSKVLKKKFIQVPVIDHYWVCRAVNTRVNKYKGNKPPAPLGFFKREFYQLLMKAVPEYCFEVYLATQVNPNSMKIGRSVSANICIYKESGKEEALYLNEVLQCSLREICSITIGKSKILSAPKWTVQIHLESGIRKVLLFAEEGAAESFVSMIQGYFRLCICYDMHLCEELRTPSSRICSEFKSLGPIGNATAVRYLQESKRITEPDTGGFFIHESLDQVGTYHVKAWSKTDMHADHNNRNTTTPGLIKCLTDMQFKLEMEEEEIKFDNCRQLRDYLTSTFGPQVLPSLKVFPVLADINDEYQEIKTENCMAPSSSEDAQSTPIGLPVIRRDQSTSIGLPVIRRDQSVGDDIPAVQEKASTVQSDTVIDADMEHKDTKTAVQEKASTVQSDTVIDTDMEHKDTKTDDDKKLTAREIKAELRTYLSKYYLDKSCLDVEGYTNVLGTGHYGAVYKGKMRQENSDHWAPVAIKRIKRENYPENDYRIDRRIVYKEIKVAVELDHPNVVKLLHLCKDHYFKELFDPVMMIMEFMNLGNLTKYAGKYGELSDAKCVSHMLKILLDVAEGMVYLSGKEIVHRDLAARNVLLCGLKGLRVTAKVSDFGLARMIEGNYRFYKLNTQDVLPFMWMPPECFTHEGGDSKFSSKGDVWSFGIVMWEAFSKGATPMKILPQNITPEQLLERYQGGWRLEGENITSKDAYSVMMGCWEMDPSKRPAFVELVQRLKKLISELHLF